MEISASIWNTLSSIGLGKRAAPLAPRGPRPRIGRIAIQGDMRITIQAGLSDELWSWLLDQGWRELRYTPDRRRYREIPAWYVTRLIDCEPHQRATVLVAATTQARSKPSAGNLETLPVYVLRR